MTNVSKIMFILLDFQGFFSSTQSRYWKQYWHNKALLRKICQNWRQAKTSSSSLSKTTNSDRERFEPPHDKTSKMAGAPSEDSYQPWHPPSLIRVFAVRMKKASVLSYTLSARRRLWSDWADAQADPPSLIWVFAGRTCHFIGFVMSLVN